MRRNWRAVLFGMVLTGEVLAQTPVPPPIPQQTTRRLAAQHSALSYGDVALALRNWLPASQVNDIDRTSGDTALTWLIGSNTPRPVQRFFTNRLLSRGAHVQAPDTHHWTPLSQAVSTGDPTLVRMLLARGAQIDWVPPEGHHVLFNLCSVSGEFDYSRELPWRLETFRVLWNANANLQVRFGGAGTRYPERGPLDDCTHNEFAPIAQQLLDAGMRHVYVRNLSRNPPPSNRVAVPSPFDGARVGSDTGMEADFTALFEAIGRGDVRAARAALPPTERINHRDQVTTTGILHWIAYMGRLPSAPREQLLTAAIERGANVNLADADGVTPLHAAVEMGWVEGVRLLLARRAATNIADRAGMQPLHNLCLLRITPSGGFREAEAVEIARMLLAAGADVNALGGTLAGYRRTPADGCTNDNIVSRAAVRAVLASSGALLLRPIGLARDGLGTMTADRDAPTPVGAQGAAVRSAP